MAVKPLASQRDAALDQLRAHFVHNTIDVDAYERRVEHVTQADDLDTMNLALADLQPLAVAQPESKTALVLPEHGRVPILSIFGSVERRGNWLTARQEKIVTVFGNAELGMLDTAMPDGVTTLDVVCVFGNVELTVPVGLRVELEVTGILGNTEDRGGRSQPSATAGGPLLRVRGVCVFGNVEIKRR